MVVQAHGFLGELDLGGRFDELSMCALQLLPLLSYDCKSLSGSFKFLLLVLEIDRHSHFFDKGFTFDLLKRRQALMRQSLAVLARQAPRHCLHDCSPAPFDLFFIGELVDVVISFLE